MNRCYFHELEWGECDFYPRGFPDPCHLVRAQRVKAAGLDPDDDRLVVPGCRKHHTEFDKGIGPDCVAPNTLTLGCHPPEFLAWVQQYGWFYNERSGWLPSADARQAA